MLGLLGLSLWTGKGIELGPINLQPIEVVGGILFLCMLAASVPNPRSGQWLSVGAVGRPFLWLLLVACATIVAAAFLSLLNAVDAPAVLSVAMRYVFGAALLLSLARFLTNPRRVRVLTRAWLLGGLLSVFAGTAGFFVPGIGAITLRYGDRTQAFLNHPNQFAMLLLTTIPVAFAIALERPRSAARWCTLIFLVGGIAMTGSKANLVLVVAALAASTMVSTQLHRRVTKRIGYSLGLGLSVLVIASLAVITLQYFTPRTYETLTRLLADPAGVSAVTSRSELWRAAVEIGLSNPWTGVGAANSVSYLPHSHAHNVILEFFMTMGLPGVVALGMLCVTTLALIAVSIWIALTFKSAPYRARLLLIAFPMGALFYVLANQTSDSFGGTTLPVLWITVSLTLAQLRLVTLGRYAEVLPRVPPDR